MCTMWNNNDCILPKNTAPIMVTSTSQNKEVISINKQKSGIIVY